MMSMVFDTEDFFYPEDDDGYVYEFSLFQLGRVLAPNKADTFYQCLTN
jgi:hypothetical protein